MTITAEVVPLHEVDGVIRIIGSRVTLDTVVAAFNEGATPEEIAQQYPTIELADIYAVIGYFLHHSREVEAYLRGRESTAEAIRRENEARFPPEGIRQRLLARRTARQ